MGGVAPLDAYLSMRLFSCLSTSNSSVSFYLFSSKLAKVNDQAEKQKATSVGN